MGLYGPIVVEDLADPKTLGDTLVLMRSDMSLHDAGQLLPKDNGLAARQSSVPFWQTAPIQRPCIST
jgi:hypothetical protein